MKNISRRNIGGFTLVEILVVVLIIGILSAVAVPMYQGAVDKTHFSTMLSPTRTLKEAQEAVRMATGNYTTDTADLDVDLSQEALSYQIKTTANGDEFNVILATNDKLPNVRLARYLDENLLLQGQLHCEAKAGDERANKLCGPLLIGQELNTVDGYTAYLLDEDIDHATCDHLGRFFGQKTNKCYKTNAERCVGLGMPYNESTEVCGYGGRGAHSGVELNEGGICSGSNNSCQNSTFNNGAVCGADNYYQMSMCTSSSFNNDSVCISSTNSDPGCRSSAFDNSLCISRGFYGGCSGSTFSNDSVCYAGEEVHERYGCFGATYNDTSCCCGGSSCPAAHRCSSNRCAEIEEKVKKVKEENPNAYTFNLK